MKELTFESVNKQIESLDLGALETTANNEAISVSDKLCKIWSKIGVIIKFIVSLPMPKKWKAALRLLITTLDSICG